MGSTHGSSVMRVSWMDTPAGQYPCSTERTQFLRLLFYYLAKDVKIQARFCVVSLSSRRTPLFD